MKNKGFIYSFLLFCLFVLMGLFSVETEVFPEEELPVGTVSECSVCEKGTTGFSYACEPFQSPVTILFDKRKGIEKCKIKSLSKFIKLRDSYTSRPVSRFVARSYSLHNLFIPHNSSLSQLQTFLI